MTMSKFSILVALVAVFCSCATSRNSYQEEREHPRFPSAVQARRHCRTTHHHASSTKRVAPKFHK